MSITRTIVSLILEERPPRYYVDLILRKSPGVPINTSMYTWFWEATALNSNNPLHSALQLRFTSCQQLERDGGDIMFSDLDNAFEDTGVIGTLVQQCCLPLSEQQPGTVGSLNNNTQAENAVEATKFMSEIFTAPSRVFVL